MGADPQGSRFLNDLKSSNSKQLLNAYIYDFLIKSSLPQTAQSFIKEADIPTGAPTTKAIKRPPQKDLLPLAISLDAPQGFLYEWWQIFWDVFNARTHRGGSENAQHYYQLQLMRQNKEHALYNSTFHAAHAQAQAQAQVQAQAQAQAQSASGQNIGVLQHQQQLFLQQQYQQQMLLLQQQQSQNALVQGQGHIQTPGGMQQQYNQYGQPIDPYGATVQPNEMGFVSQPIHQQEVQQHFQQQQSQLFAGQKRGVVPSNNGGPLYANNNYGRVQQAQLQMNQFRQQQHQPQVPDPQTQFKVPGSNNSSANGSANNTQRTNSPNKRPKLEDSSAKGSPLSGSPVNSTGSHKKSPLPHTQDGSREDSSAQSPLTVEPEVNGTATSGTSALQDYQRQLMLLERENKKMLNGSKKDSISESAKKDRPSPATKKQMLPPKKTKASTPAESPAASVGKPMNGSSSTALKTVKKKKETAASRRRTKKSATSTSEPPTPTTPLTPDVTGINPSLALTKKEVASSGLSSKSKSTKKAQEDDEPISQQSKDKNTPSNVSQLTPPNSENATNNNGDLMTSNNDDLTTDPTMAPELSNDLGREFSGHDDEILGASQMINGGHSSNDLYADFPLSDFSNEISGDANFNLETFLNTDGTDLGNFESYWRDGVEATD